MLILTETKDVPSPRCCRVDALFGVGLIGSSIRRGLLAQGQLSEAELPFSWENPELHEGQLGDIRECITQCIDSAGGQQMVNIIWSAGRGGFYSDEAETGQELETYKKVIAFTRELAEHLPGVSIAFHLVSSAGGLFEGAHGNAPLKPTPVRPYGHMKLEQESCLQGLPSSMRKRVYRPSSVYGYIGSSSRMGLVQALIVHGARGNISTIDGDANTLRDYVFSEDIGRFITRQLTAPDETMDACYTLASGKPSSICEIQGYVQKTVRKKLYLSFRKTPDNRRSICFSPGELPHDWHPTEIHTGIRMVYRRWMGRDAA